jgi:hypothetical protein
MKTAKIFLMSLVLALLVSGPAWAQEEAAGPAVNVAGEWDFTSESPRGTRTTRIVFEQDGETLTGHAVMMQGREMPLTGTVKGDVITFTISFSRGDRTMEMTYTGKVAGDTAEGTMATPRGEVPWTATKVS